MAQMDVLLDKARRLEALEIRAREFTVRIDQCFVSLRFALAIVSFGALDQLHN